jgi:uncharacterized glyoxalase superfamily protein PhnB
MEDDSSMLTHAMEFYRKLFGTESKENIKLSEDFWSEDEKITKEENETLEAELTEDEIRRAVFDSYAEGPLALMGFLFSSIKKSGLLLKQIS